jgi:hypothetical protein
MCWEIRTNASKASFSKEKEQPEESSSYQEKEVNGHYI